MLILYTWRPPQLLKIHIQHEALPGCCSRFGVWGRWIKSKVAGEMEPGKGQNSTAFHSQLFSSQTLDKRIRDQVTWSVGELVQPGGLSPPQYSSSKHSVELHIFPSSEHGSAGCQPPHLPGEITAQIRTWRWGPTPTSTRPLPPREQHREVMKGSEEDRACPEVPFRNIWNEVDLRKQANGTNSPQKPPWQKDALECGNVVNGSSPRNVQWEGRGWTGQSPTHLLSWDCPRQKLRPMRQEIKGHASVGKERAGFRCCQLSCSFENEDGHFSAYLCLWPTEDTISWHDLKKYLFHHNLANTACSHFFRPLLIWNGKGSVTLFTLVWI